MGTVEKAKREHLKDLLSFYQYMLDVGHTFWCCAQTDKEKGRPYYFVQVHRTKNMCTCSTCYGLIELKGKIIRLQRTIKGCEVWPWRYHYLYDGQPRISVNTSNPYSPNFNYLLSQNPI